MEEHIVVYRYVSAAKGKLKVKRPRQSEVGDKLEDLRSELDNLTSLLPLEESEQPDENLRAELERLPSPELQEPKELEEYEEAKDLEEAKEHAEPKESEEAEEQEAEEHKEPKGSEEAEEHKVAEGLAEPKQAEEAKEKEERKESVRTLDGLVKCEVLRSKRTVQAWYQDLLRNLRIFSALPKVTNSTFCDARKLFGVNRVDSKVTLRNPGYVGGYEDIVLLQFDPNFMSTEVVCRHPSCNNINSAAETCGKRDLYLCPHHQQALRNSISDALNRREIQSASAEKPEPGQYAGYTSLISLLEGAFHDSKKVQTPQGKYSMLQEAILNVRNFLIITTTLLNPDENNLGIALPPVVEILKLILENPESVERVVAILIPLLREVMKMILSAFEIIYTWVSFALRSPGAQIGVGVGGFLGALGFVFGPWSGAAGVAVGGTLGGLVGNGVYNLSGVVDIDGLRSNKQPHNQHLVFYFNGDVKGGFYMSAFQSFQP